MLRRFCFVSSKQPVAAVALSPWGRGWELVARAQTHNGSVTAESDVEMQDFRQLRGADMTDLLRTFWSNKEGQDIAEDAVMLAVILGPLGFAFCQRQDR